MEHVIWEGDTVYGHYQVVDTLYDGRPARVLYSGERHTAQSGVAKDDKPDLLFDYNQRMFELVTNLVPGRILLIGGAVETLPIALLDALPDVMIDVVEPDEGLTKLAYDFFDMPVTERLRIIHTDGRSFMRSSTDKYDVILVDAFMRNIVPRDMRTGEAFEALANHLRPDGVLAMNVISSYYGRTSHVLREVYGAATAAFRITTLLLASRGYSLWLPQNFVLTAQKTTDLPLKDYVRYDAIDPPDVPPYDVLHDTEN